MTQECLLCGTQNSSDMRNCSLCGSPLNLDDIKVERFSSDKGEINKRIPGEDNLSGNAPPLMVLSDGTILKNTYQVYYWRRGGMGAIYTAYHVETRQKYIIKEAVATDAKDQSHMMMALSRERETLIRFVHPDIVKCKDFFIEDDAWYLVLEYIEGQTLAEIQDAIKPNFLSELDVTDWALQMADIMNYMHTLNPCVIHRDLKPANIMLTPQGKIKLIDFGIARTQKKDKKHDTEVIGTVGFCPPEQFGDSQTDHRADIYSLGAIMHSMLTNIYPGSENGNPFDFRPVKKINPNICLELESLISKATQVERDKRFATTKDMLLSLKNIHQVLLNKYHGCPRLQLDPASIDLMRLSPDEDRTANFLVTNSGKGILEGNITIPDMKGISVDTTSFRENKNLIQLKIHTSEIPQYKDQKIRIVVTTNGGSAVLPVKFGVGLNPKFNINTCNMRFIITSDEITVPKDLIIINEWEGNLEGLIINNDPYIVIDTRKFNKNFIKIPVKVEPYHLLPGNSVFSTITLKSNGGNAELVMEVLAKNYSYKYQEEILNKINDENEKLKLNQMLVNIRIKEPEIRKELLGEIRNEYNDIVMPYIIEAMNRDSDEGVREAAFKIILTYEGEELLNPCIKALDNSSPNIRRMAAEELGKICNEKALQYLLKHMADNDPDVRKAATDAVTKIGSKRASETLAPIKDAIKNIDINTATQSLQNVQNAAKNFWTRLMKKK